MIKFVTKMSNFRQKTGKKEFSEVSVFAMLMNSIGFLIENLSYNWSTITYRNLNTNSIDVFIVSNISMEMEMEKNVCITNCP